MFKVKSHFQQAVDSAKHVAREETEKFFETAKDQLSASADQYAAGVGDITGLDASHASLSADDKDQVAYRTQKSVDALTAQIQSLAIQRAQEREKARQAQFSQPLEKATESSQLPPSKPSRRQGGAKQKIKGAFETLSRGKAERGRNTST